MSRGGSDEPSSASPGRGRTRARRLVLEAFAEADLRGGGFSTAQERIGELDDAPPYAIELANGLVADAEAVDAAIRRFLRADWPLERLGAVERAVLRIGTWELTRGDTPAEVAIDEAVELAKRYASEPAGRLVNGVLAALYRSGDAPQEGDHD